jgi:hypothetical protein
MTRQKTSQRQPVAVATGVDVEGSGDAGRGIGRLSEAAQFAHAGPHRDP